MIKNMIHTEFIKLKRYSILSVGFLLAIFSPLLVIYQSSFFESKLTVHRLISDTVWNNSILFFPLIAVIIGGYIINREYTDGTIKNMLVIPLSFRVLIIGKIMLVLILMAFFGVCNFFSVTFLSILLGLTDFNVDVMLLGFKQIFGMSIFSTLAVFPIIICCARKLNLYMGGIAVTFVYAYAGSFLAGRDLQDFYPITAGLGLVNYSGQTGSQIITFRTDIEIAIIVLEILVSIILLFFLEPKECGK